MNYNDILLVTLGSHLAKRKNPIHSSLVVTKNPLSKVDKDEKIIFPGRGPSKEHPAACDRAV